MTFAEDNLWGQVLGRSTQSPRPGPSRTDNGEGRRTWGSLIGCYICKIYVTYIQREGERERERERERRERERERERERD